jgi:mannose-6-phosphate isomerase-like protein (cupin superfamily)
MRRATPQPFDSSTHRVHFEDGPRARALEVTPTFWRDLPPELAGGRILGASLVASPEELHPDTWEMHPEGDELLFLFSGAIDAILESASGDQRISLTPGSSLIVPAGVWHRLLLREPGLLVVVTRGAGTRMRPVDYAA